jgi:hypothetical protein
MKPDKYACDFRLCRDWAAIDYRAAKVLFQTEDPFLYFPAATLGHHALEMYLKSALIVNGMTVFDPEKIKSLDAGIVLAKSDCIWGHELMRLAEVLARRSPDFDLSKTMDPAGFLTMKEPMTVGEGLAVFEPFFSELRYPQAMNRVAGLGFEHEYLLDRLVTELRHARFKWNQSP